MNIGVIRTVQDFLPFLCNSIFLLLYNLLSHIRVCVFISDPFRGHNNNKWSLLDKNKYLKPCDNLYYLRILENIELYGCRNIICIIREYLKTYCPVSWGCRIHWLHLCRGVRPPLTSVMDMALNNLMVRFQQCWSFEECGVPLHCHRSQVHSSPEW